MRRRITFLLLLLCLVLAIPVAAHSGGTDANGGHYDGGSYHYHHGYPAHQHTGGVCPYDFDDRTGWNSGTSGSSGSSASKSTPKPTLKPTPKPTPTPEPKKDSNRGWLWFWGLFGAFLAGFYLWVILSDIIDECKLAHDHGMTRKQYRAYLERERQAEARKVSQLRDCLYAERKREQLMIEWRHERRLIADALLRAVYSGRTPADFVEMQLFVKFGNSSLLEVEKEFVRLGVPLNPPKLLPPPQIVRPPYSHTT